MKLERIENPNRELFEQFVLNNKPFIITNSVSNWECFKKWLPTNNNKINEDYLSTMIKNKQIPVRENVDYSSGEWLGKTTEIDFQIFYSLWKEHYIQFKQQSNNSNSNSSNNGINDDNNNNNKKPKYYLASLPVKTYFKELENDYITPEIPLEQNKSANLWIGFKDQVTPLHHDFSSGDPGMDGLHAVIIGKKLFKLFDPELNVGCFKRKREWGQFHHAEFDIDKPDYNLYPEARSAICINVELNQGEILYIPKLWWHYVKTLEPSISLNFWFQHMGSEMLKLTKLWGHMEDYLDAVYNMSTNQVSNDKMKSILNYLGDGKQSYDDHQIQQYKDDPFRFMKFPKFINSFSNAVNNPLFRNHPSKEQFKIQMTQLVNNWIDRKELERKQQENK
ncbi:hypothetical protein DICPUDRAFT_154113 [Dictyostelium purpureum]|uniref:JmjC domain-containing protein n=1 Tax=Dictyostelium purpureum TaxID=5786 RepID=F0ZQL8_DICPU|nr:uncharacterized protein DICPUDRAFT_154113 [Dictyostelium purpureum]EGC33788.1 hypothetical protein DICPUDRAFT_154113 [Dictyostelium purpureum]|eukprot:XP_003289713.1 hypothetical protein DICPUDRAFT_154113 [Dictyostelium purpureum]